MKSKFLFWPALPAIFCLTCQNCPLGLCQPGLPQPLPASPAQNSVKGSASLLRDREGQDLLLAPGSQTSKSSPLLSSLVSSDIDLTIERYDVVLKNRHGLLIQVKNKTDRAVLFDGNRARATIGTAQYSAAPLAEIDHLECPPNTPMSKFNSDLKATVTATLTVGAVQTIDDEKIDSRGVRQRYGCDESRRLAELARFGQRILWPGDQSEGVIYFNTENSLKGAWLELPLNSFYNQADVAVVTSHAVGGPSPTGQDR